MPNHDWYFVARYAGLGDRRHVGQVDQALARRHREQAQLAGLDRRLRRQQVDEHDLDLAAEQVLQRRRAALVGDVHQIDAGQGFEQLGRQVHR